MVKPAAVENLPTTASTVTTTGRSGGGCWSESPSPAPAPSCRAVGVGRASPRTCWDEDDADAREAAQDQSQHLAPPAAQPLHHKDAGVAGGDLHRPEDQLRQVDVQAKVTDLEAQAEVPQTVHKPTGRPGVPVTARGQTPPTASHRVPATDTRPPEPGLPLAPSPDIEEDQGHLPELGVSEQIQGAP